MQYNKFIESEVGIMTKKRNMKQKKTKKNKNAYNDDYGQEFGSDETFAFIAGFTDGGAPYGITWEEWEEIEKAEQKAAKENLLTKVKFDDLPF